jgi:hypothetical protein
MSMVRPLADTMRDALHLLHPQDPGWHVSYWCC